MSPDHRILKIKTFKMCVFTSSTANWASVSKEEWKMETSSQNLSVCQG